MAYENGYIDPDTMRAWQEWQGLRDEDIANGLINNKQIRMSPEKNRMFWDNERARIAAMPVPQPMGNGGVMPGQGMSEIPPSGRFNNGLPDNSFYEGEWTSPQTQIPYYRNEFEGTLIRRDTNPAGISVADSTADLNRHRAMWAQQNMQPLPIAQNISTIANARHALINAHGISPMQLPVSQQPPQLAMNMAASLGIGQRVDPATGQTYTGGLGSHAPIHSQSFLAAQLPAQARQAAIAAHNAELQRAAEQHALAQNQAIGASLAANAIPNAHGIAVLTDKQAEELYKVGAEEEAARKGVPVDNVIAWRKFGFNKEKARLLTEVEKSKPKLPSVVPLGGSYLAGYNTDGSPIYKTAGLGGTDTTPKPTQTTGTTPQPQPTPQPTTGGRIIVTQNGHRFSVNPDGSNPQYIGPQTGQ